MSHSLRISGLQGKIVDDRASIVGHSRAETVAGIDADHRGIARFENRDDQGYQVVWGAPQDYIGAVLKSIKTAETMMLWKWKHEKNALDLFYYQSALSAEIEWRNRAALLVNGFYEAFQAWQSALRSSFLFVLGRPGCGKSVLAKYLYSQMLVEASKSQCVASYLFDGQEDEIGRSMEGLIRSLLSEVIEKKLTLINRTPISQEYKILKDTQQTSLVEWPLTALKNLFRSLGDAEDTEYLFIVDALDEAKPEDISDISQLLEGLLSVDNKATFKIILTARPATFVQESFAKSYPRIWLESKDSSHVQKDIKTYITNKVTQYFRGDPKARPLAERLHACSNGIFIWVDLVLRMLAEERKHGTPFSDLVKELDNRKDETFDELCCNGFFAQNGH
uniref:Meroterpenoid PM-122-9-9852 n=1 Tax=Penicillium brasilianum TaxID=104259 RepID=A0A3G3C7F2_PENBI|nr:meroterpenoid PM-122-9-9852 [Penicillium brasilianum]